MSNLQFSHQKLKLLHSPLYLTPLIMNEYKSNHSMSASQHFYIRYKRLDDYKLIL